MRDNGNRWVKGESRPSLEMEVVRRPDYESEVLHSPGDGFLGRIACGRPNLSYCRRGPIGSSTQLNGLSNFDVCRDIRSIAKRTVFLHTTSPVLEYGAAVWDANSKERSRLEAIKLKAFRLMIRTASTSARGPVREGFGVGPLEAQTGVAKLGGDEKLEQLDSSRKEIKELQNKEIGLKKAAAKGSKAEQKAKKKLAEEEVARLDTKLKARHVKELASLGIPVDDKELNSIEVKVKAIAGVSLNGSSTQHRPSKGQKWRDRRAQQEAEREQRIQEEQNNVVSERVLEDQQLEGKLGPLGFTLKEIKSDGHCLYRAVEDQIALHPELVQYSHQELRRLAANYMRTHADDFMPFIGGETTEGDNPDDTVQTKFERYCGEVESTAAWGGQLELGALSHALRKHIVVYSATLPDVEMGKEYKEDSLEGAPLLNPSIRVSYHRHAFGLGEHYNSVVPVDPTLVQDTVKA